MTTRLLKTPQTRAQQCLWFGAFVAAAMATSFVFACAVPFAALAAMAALMLPRKSGVVFMLSAWGANQLVGFAFLGYPLDATTFAWGAIMGFAAVSAGFFASLAAEKLRERVGEVALMGAALVAGFSGFQAVLLAANLTPLGSVDGFIAAIQGRVLLVETMSFAAFFLASYAASQLTLLLSRKQWA